MSAPLNIFDHDLVPYGQFILGPGDHVMGLELLARWRPADGSWPVSHLVVAPEIERLGLQLQFDGFMCSISRAVLQRAPDLKVHVNVGAVSLQTPGCAQTLLAGIDPAMAGQLVLELTEGDQIREHRVMAKNLRHLVDAGVSLSLDDYGTHFSLPILAGFLPMIHQAKLAREFIEHIDSSRDARRVVEAHVRVLHHLGLQVLGEGVERQAQADILADFGVQLFQGYHFHRPEQLESLAFFAQTS